MAILSKAYKTDNFEFHNSLKLSFTNIQGLRRIFFIANLSLNQTLLTFLLCVRQTWMTQLILVISLRGYLPLIERILVLISMVSQFMWKKDFLLHGTYPKKTLQIVIYVFDWLYFTQCLTSFSSNNLLLPLCARFLILFHLSEMRFSR